MVPSLTRRRVLGLTAAGSLGLIAAPTVASNGKASYFVHPDGPTRNAADAVRDHGGRVTHTYSTFDFIAGRVPTDNVEDLRKDGRVGRIERDGRVEAHHHRDDHDGGPPGGGDDDGDCADHPAEEPSWGWDRIDAGEVDETGQGVDIAILDTGIDEAHCDLVANLAGGHNCTNGPARNWDDKNGHGTHCAGIASAAANDIGVVGVAPGANLWGVKVLGNGGTGSWSDVVCGIDWCIENAKEILSMSFGGGPNDTVAEALATAYAEGHLLVSSAGNSGNDEDGECEENNVGFPASHPDVIAVSAMDRDNTIAGYSSVGSDVELLAPGTDIRSTYTDDGYDTLSGTSMAAPHVSGVGALVWETYESNGPSSDNKSIRTDLHDSVEVVLGTCEEGHGLVQADGAVS